MIYIYCVNKKNEKYSYIKFYSLNGINFSELITKKKIINFFAKEALVIIYEKNFIEAFNLYEIDGMPLYKFEPLQKFDKNNIKQNKNIKIRFCILNEEENKLVIIYEDNQVAIEDISHLLKKD